MACSGPSSTGIAIEWTHSDHDSGYYFRVDFPGVFKVCSLAHLHANDINIASAFNAIVSSSVVALDLSYAMPIAVNCLRGRKLLPPRAWQLPSGMGWLADMVSYRVTCYVVQSASAYERNAAWLVVYCSDNGAVSVSTWAAGHWE